MKFKALFYILSALALALWVFCGMVFMQDELSALSRLEYDSLGELFDQGIRPDGHPAFVQLFLYLWTGLFGFSEWAVKIPSLLCGLGSLWLSYRLAKKIFDAHVALMTVALVGLSQYFVLYFSLARPYAYGTFFTLAQIYSLVQWRDKGSRPYQWSFLLFTVLSAYTHYFSMLVAGLVTLWGFLWLKKSQLKGLVISIVLAILLFLPHVPISLHQLGLGGLGGPEGWLSAPDSDFTLKYLSYLAQNHVAGLGLFLAAGAMTLLRLPKMTSDQGRFVLLGLGVLFIPLFIGYQYSVKVNPVIQFSVLIFGAIPFLIALLSGFKFLGQQAKTALLLVVIAVTLYGLVEERHHAGFSTVQPYADLVDFAESKPGAFVMGDMNERFIGQYDKSRDLDYHYESYGEKSLSEIHKALTQNPQARLLVGNRAELVPMSFDAFPDRICWRIQKTFETVSLGEASPAACDEPSLSYTGPPLERLEGQEFGGAYEMDLNAIDGYPFITLAVRQSIDSISMTDGTLVSEVYQGDSLIHWLGRDVSQYAVPTSTGLNTYLSIRLQDVLKPHMREGQYRWKVYYWNRAKEPLQGEAMHIRVFPDTPQRYGLFEEF